MEKSRLRIANAGIPWPILVRNGHAQELKIDGTPLGIFPDLDCEILEFATQPQNIFVFASDGILESMRAHEEQLGFERLAETLWTVRPDMSSRHICAAILAATDKFSGRQQEPHDDRTLVVLRIN
jgi:serine phosphatase RsbU (regulator of sigma subunit)